MAKTVQELVLALQDEDCDVRTDAAEALGRMGPAAKAAAPALTQALEDEDEWVRDAAAEALKTIKGE